MPDPIIFAASNAWVGLAKETVEGTQVTPPTAWVPVMEQKHIPHLSTLVDQALRGNMAQDQAQVAGVRYDEFSYKTYCYQDTLPHHMVALLGSTDTVTGSADPWTHTIGLFNGGSGQPPSYSLYMHNGSELWTMLAAKLVSLDIDIKPDGLVELSPTWYGYPATNGGAEANTPSTVLPAPAWNTTVTIGGSAAAVYSSLKISAKRNDANPVFTASGSQNPYSIFVGSLEITGELNAVYQGYAGAPTDLNAFLANTQRALVVKVNPAGDATHFGQWTMTKCALTDSNVEAQNGYQQLSTKYRALANSADGVSSGVGPLKFVLASAQSAAY